MRLFVGTSGYAYKEWKGSFYPEKLAAAKMLAYYGERFNSVEINNTFYRMPSESVLVKWSDDVPDDFAFVLKASRRITHFKRLKEEANEELQYVVRTASVLGSKLGPTLFQLPPNMKMDVARLTGFLQWLPKRWRAAFEFRHESWLVPEVYDALRDHNAALVIADTDEATVPFELTADWGYLRLRRPEYTDAELQQWAARIDTAGWRDVFAFFKHEDEGTGPKLANRFRAVAAPDSHIAPP